MPVRQFGEGFFVGWPGALGRLLGLGIQFQLLEYDFAHLLGRADIQRGHLRIAADLGLACVHLLAQALRKILQGAQVHLHAHQFHTGEHADERFLDFVVELAHPGLFQFGKQHPGEFAYGLRLLAMVDGIFGHREQGAGVGCGHIVEADAEVALGEGRQAVVAFGIDEIVHQFHIQEFALEGYSHLCKGVHLGFDAEGGFAKCGIL